MAYDGWNLLGGFRLLGDSLGGLARWSDGCFWLTLVLLNLNVQGEQGR